ncbi:hypothetical protein DIE22_01735 [Burkholderia sp. Bp9142]|nr:hypothetical protein DIE22_01735 [Burkholderia sp. Bp9142]
MWPRRNTPGIRVCTGLTHVFQGPPALHPAERFAAASAIHSDERNFFKVHLVEQNSKLTHRNMAG